MTVVTVACAARLGEAHNLVKSLLLFTRCKLSIIVFTDPEYTNETTAYFRDMISAPIFWNMAVNLTVLQAAYPARLENITTWRGMFAPCASLRLYFPVKTRFYWLTYLISWRRLNVLFQSEGDTAWRGLRNLLGFGRDRGVPDWRFLVRVCINELVSDCRPGPRAWRRTHRLVQPQKHRASCGPTW